jgi:hypothetical protein
MMEPPSNVPFNVTSWRYSTVRIFRDEDDFERLLGRAVQVDPIKLKLKPPGTKRLKL